MNKNVYGSHWYNRIHRAHWANWYDGKGVYRSDRYNRTDRSRISWTYRTYGTWWR